MARKPEPPAKLFSLTYRHPDGAGLVVIEYHGLLHARLKASLSGADRGLQFADAAPSCGRVHFASFRRQYARAFEDA